MGNPFGWSYPPGVTESMIPGNRPEDAAWERLFDQLPDECPKCKQPVHGDPKDWKNHGLAPHVRVIGADSCSPEIRCEFEAEEDEPCEETLADSGRCGCPDCKGEDF